MAHLIKLEDYESRYQFDLNRYPSQFSRMKRERWYYLKNEWEQAQQELDVFEVEAEEQTNESGWKELFQRLFSRKDKLREDEPAEDEKLRLKSMTLPELKQMFLDELFISQLRWASSSLLGESSLDPRYKRDEWLRFFTLQLPDNYFLMYKPVFHIKKAPIDLDIVLISPAELILITLLEGHEYSIFEASTNRFWIEYVHQEKRKRLSPLLSMTRMSGVIETILKENQFSFPIRRIVLSPTSMIDNRLPNINVEIVDKRTFRHWHESLKRQPSPLKHEQMKVTAILLDYCSPQGNSDDETE